MNQLQRARASRKAVTPTTLLSPIKGWNTRDPFEAMDPLDAILMDNWYPDFGGVVSRTGSTNFATGLGSAPVQTLAWFNSSTTSKFLAGCNGRIWDVTSGTGVLKAAGFISDIWCVVTFNSKQFWCNGYDWAQIYDGSAVSRTTFTGANMASMGGVGVFNNRLYFWTGKDPSFWYGGVNSITGALTQFSLATVSQAGGNLVSVDVLSYDGGTGIQAYTCFFMSSGEVLIYTGTDPSSATNWSLTGRYVLPPPISSPRSIARFGGDIYVITGNDHQQLSSLLIALKQGETPPRTKISGAAKDAYDVGSLLPGWQALYYPAGTRMLYNIPNPDGTFSQHIYNTSTQAWCRFRDWNAYCFGIYENKLYFGAANGVVTQADIGLSDNSVAVVSQGQQAWQTFKTPLKKRITAVRSVVQSQGIASFNMGLGYDYRPANITVPDSTVSTLANPLIWGATNWGSPYVWGGEGATDPRWHIAGGEGAAIGLTLSASTLAGATWLRTDLLIEPGSAL